MKKVAFKRVLKKPRLFVYSLMLLCFSAWKIGAAQSLPAPDSLDIKIGQLLMIGFRGLHVADSSKVIVDIRQQRIGGVILFDYDLPLKQASRNIQSPEQVCALIKELQAAAPIPLLIAIDQEGGRVNRLKEKFGFPKSVSAAWLGEVNSLDSTQKYAEQTAKTLAALGINLNFAPVLDVNTNPENPVIGKLARSFSENPEIVAEHGLATVKAFHQFGVLSAVKHFPGHGSAWNDSHKGLADVTETWQPLEIEPFKRVIQAGECDMVMTAHVFNAKLDTTFPATLSQNVITGLLRKELGFDGVVVSDDMQMEAIRSFYGLETAVRLALNAGVDLLVFANNSVFEPDIAERAHQMIRAMVLQGKVSRERIDASYQRLMKLKSRLSNK
ncbi:Beta-N-acetylhexosaminidase [Chloroherpeton thalassium ATCC 35110]|uniref:beta-N-acetylhexosaminidase n=1 Tax=Chloroherpeton thalassium (strain ATCC 35110 / GB-78) TaxID=517418 RepID=B3QTH0_CHLT3|nr:glycoside hydrolase family 3 protein [Chloroherpeton thalassium]ACF12716.1 Beta-N-acetylhexosaminidase [Chloroherpeton thalassium ATCC 35110]